MIIELVERYKFSLTDEEIKALELISNIDCSDATNCKGCPLRVKVPDNDIMCLRGMIIGVLERLEAGKNA